MSRSYRRLFNTLLSGIDRTLGLTRLTARPLRIHIEVNDYCNLRCPYCPREHPAIQKDTGNIPVEIIERLLPWIRRANYVGLAGNGEPFLHPRILDILRLITEAGAAPSVVTNGTRLRPEHIEALPRLGPMLLNISMDGGRKETFERWRRGADFDEVIGNLKALNEAKRRAGSVHPIVNFNVCLMTENLDETELLVDLAEEVGATVVLFQTMFPYVKELDYLRVKDLGRIEEAVARARRRAQSLGIRIEYYPMSFDLAYREGVAEENIVGSVQELDAKVGGAAKGDAAAPESSTTPPSPAAAEKEEDAESAPCGSPRLRPVYHCRNIWQQLHVTLNGDVRYCCFWTGKVVGNILRDDLETLWNNAGWSRLRRTLRRGGKPVPCQGCHNLVRHSPRAIWAETREDWKNLMRS